MSDEDTKKLFKEVLRYVRLVQTSEIEVGEVLHEIEEDPDKRLYRIVEGGAVFAFPKKKEVMNKVVTMDGRPTEQPEVEIKIIPITGIVYYEKVIEE